MNQQPESKQKIEPEHYYQVSYGRAGKSHKAQPAIPHRRLGGTSLGTAEDCTGERLYHEIIGIVAGFSLIVTIVALGCAVNHFGGMDNTAFLVSAIKTFLFIPLPIMMLRYQSKSVVGNVLRVCALIAPVAISVMSCILCFSEPITEQGIQHLYHIRLLAVFGTIAYALLQAIVRGAYYIYNKYKQD
jgi:hypothetical protein